MVYEGDLLAVVARWSDRERERERAFVLIWDGEKGFCGFVFRTWPKHVVSVWGGSRI